MVVIILTIAYTIFTFAGIFFIRVTTAIIIALVVGMAFALLRVGFGLLTDTE